MVGLTTHISWLLGRNQVLKKKNTNIEFFSAEAVCIYETLQTLPIFITTQQTDLIFGNSQKWCTKNNA